MVYHVFFICSTLVKSSVICAHNGMSLKPQLLHSPCKIKGEDATVDKLDSNVLAVVWSSFGGSLNGITVFSFPPEIASRSKGWVLVALKVEQR